MTVKEILEQSVIIPKGSEVTYLKSGYTKEFYVPTVSILLQIDRDNTAELIMYEDSYEVLKKLLSQQSDN